MSLWNQLNDQAKYLRKHEQTEGLREPERDFLGYQPSKMTHSLHYSPTMVAKIRTPARKSATTNRYSTSFSGVGVSPMVVSVSVDQ